MVSINGIGNTNKRKQALSCLSDCIEDKVLDKVHMLRIQTIVYGLSSVFSGENPTRIIPARYQAVGSLKI